MLVMTWSSPHLNMLYVEGGPAGRQPSGVEGLYVSMARAGPELGTEGEAEVARLSAHGKAGIVEPHEVLVLPGRVEDAHLGADGEQETLACTTQRQYHGQSSLRYEDKD